MKAGKNVIYLMFLGFGIPGFLVGSILSSEPWMGLQPGILLIFAVLIFAVLGFGVGSVIGAAKGRTWQASWLGLVLGPLGWLIARALPPSRERGNASGRVR